jgi:uncharacterized metal-binding protein
MKKVIVIPCSGVGKAFGSVGREATFMVVEQLRPEETRTACLSLLTLGDEEAVRLVRQNPVITIDGCPKACAEVNVRSVGAHSQANFKVIDTYREHKDLKMKSALNIGEAGLRLARALAEKVAAQVDALTNEEKHHG